MIPALSIVLCTQNRAAQLREALQALAGQAPGTPFYEILVIDNASEDNTPAVVADAARRWPALVRSLHVPTPGLSYARNAGIAAARAPLLAFTDDDVRVSPTWVREIVRAFSEDPEVAYLGGPVRPHWPSSPPSWLTREHWAALGVQDYGDRPFVVGAGRQRCLIAASLAIRASVITEVGWFSPHVQRVGDGVGSTEDSEYQERLWRHGFIGRYVPGIVAEGIVESRRLQRAYHRRWHLGHGRFVARMHVPEVEAYGGRRVGGVPAHIIRAAAASVPGRDRRALWFALGFARERLLGRRRRPVAQSGMVSIVIPCFNQGDFLADAITSALPQATDIIVVDDGSTDGSAAVAARFTRVRMLRQRNRGVAAARNTGLRAARGEFVLFLDADDRLRPGAVAALKGALETDPHAALAYGAYQPIDAQGAPAVGQPAPRAPGGAHEAMLQSNFICVPGAVLYRRAAVLRVGGFPPGVDAAADYGLYLQLTRDHPLVRVPLVVVEYRRHGGGMSARPDRMLAATLRAHRRHRPGAVIAPMRAAWRAGRRYWQEFYGNQFVDRIREEWRGGQRVRASGHAAVLAWRAPRVFFWHLRRKLALYWNRNSANLLSS